MKLRLWSVAEQELSDAALWYEEQRTGLGSEFLSEFERAMTAIEHDPAGFPLLESVATERPIRRCRLKKFPYLLVFEILASEVVVYAVIHLSQHSETLVHRISGDS